MLCLALALALAFVSQRTALQSAALTAVTALVVWFLRPPLAWTELVFVGCWASVIVTGALSYWPDGVPPRLAPIAATNAGLWAGAVSSVAGRSSDLLLALSVVLLAVPARALIHHGGSIGLKVVSSWLIAVATLAAMVSLTPTPGYAQDHKD